ncbi:MAG: outer membrane beta-barrel protein [Burkholderiales bacterium]
MITLLRPAFAVLAASLAAAALAQGPAQDAGGWHLGGGIRPPTGASEDAGIGYRNFGGFRFSPRWGVEMGYAGLGRDNAAEYTSLGGQKLALQSSTWTLAGTGVLPIGDTFSLQGRFGMSLATPETAVAAPGMTYSAPGLASSGIGVGWRSYRPAMLWGVGGQYDLSNRVGLRVDYNSFGRTSDDASGSRADLWSINAVVHF